MTPGAAGTYKINADNQLGLAPAVALDLGSGATELLHRVAWVLRRGRRRIASRASVAWRAALKRRGSAGHLHLGRITLNWSACVNGWRTADHLRGRSTSWPLGSLRAHAPNGGRRRAACVVVCRVTGRTRAGTRMVHGLETLLRRRGGNGGGGTGSGELLRYLRGPLASRRRRWWWGCAGGRCCSCGAAGFRRRDAGGGFTFPKS